MSLWENDLTRENFDEFFRQFAPSAYRSVYKVLGDTTRTESALSDAFLEAYHKRSTVAGDDIVFLFSDVLEKKVTALSEKYPISESMHRTNHRVMDEFTQNSLLSELHQRMDSTSFRVIEFITSSSTGKQSVHMSPIFSQLKNTGISVILVIQLLITAIIIFLVTAASSSSIFKIDDILPDSPANSSITIEDKLVSVLQYLPLVPVETTSDSQTVMPIDTATTDTATTDTATTDTAPTDTTTAPAV